MLLAQLTEMYTVCFDLQNLKPLPVANFESYSNFVAVDVQSSP